VKRLPTYKKFLEESEVDPGSISNPPKFNLRIPSRIEALRLQQGDQVIDKTQQEKGVGMIISLNDKKGTAIVNFYDDLVDSTFNQNIPFHVEIENLFAVAAQEN
jgi:hypothetical protein